MNQLFRRIYSILTALALMLGFMSVTPAPLLTAAANAVSVDGSTLRLDATNPSSYAGTGTTWSNLKTGSIGNATLLNGTAFNSRGKHFAFDGVDDYMTIPAFTRDFRNGISAHAVVDFGTTAENWERIFDFGNGADTTNILFGRNGTTNNLAVHIFSAGVGNDYFCNTTSDSVIKPGFHTYGFTISSAGVCKIYIDGVEVANSVTGSLSLPNIQLNNNYIGESNWSGDAFFKGSIQSIVLYNSVKSIPDCLPLESNFTGTGTGSVAAATFGVNGVRYKELKFLTTGKCAWSIPDAVSSIELLVVGGGGGGGFGSRAGGGGAGEVTYKSSYAVTPNSSIEVSIGFAGGKSTYASNGGNSYFGSIQALGGGRGGGDAGAELTGGSSGGRRGIFNGSAPAATTSNNSGFTSLAFAGGGSDGSSWGAGGGGAGGAASFASDYSIDTNQPDGGPSVTIFGHELAGGGGGWMGGSFASSGGGTVGGYWVTGGASVAGAVNTGSGGGSDADGGAGITIVRYALPQVATPGSFAASTISGARKSINATWTSVLNSEGYEIDLYDENDNFLVTVPVASGTSKIINTTVYAGLDDDTIYKLYIRALGDDADLANSDFSSVSQVQTHPELTLTITQEFLGKYSRRSIVFSFEFSEVVSGFTADDITLSGTNWTKGSLSGSGRSYELVVSNASATIDENVTVSVGVSAVSAQATAVVGPSTSSGGIQAFSRGERVDKWIKFLWGEDLERF